MKYSRIDIKHVCYTGWCRNNVKTGLTTDICHGTYSGAPHLFFLQTPIMACFAFESTRHERWLQVVMALVILGLVPLWFLVGVHLSPRLVPFKPSRGPRSLDQGQSLSGLQAAVLVYEDPPSPQSTPPPLQSPPPQLA